MDFINSLMILSLQYFAKLTHSYGMAIVLLTVAVRLILWPLVSQSTTSMQKMSKLQPKLKELQDRYKDKPEILQSKIMEFYKENKVNPMGGCLPLLIQIPVFIALYATFSGPPFADKVIPVKVKVIESANKALTTHEEASSANCNYISTNGQICKIVVFPGDSTVTQGSSVKFGVRAASGVLPPGFDVIWKGTAKDKQLNNDIEVNANGEATFKHIGEFMVEAKVPGIAKNDSFGFIHGLGKVVSGMEVFKPENFDVIIMVVLFGATMYLSQKFTVVQSVKKPNEEMDEAQIIQQQTMKTMPIAMTVMFLFIPIPAGVFIYMVISNVMQTMQSYIVQKLLAQEDQKKTSQVVLETGNTINIGSIENAQIEPNSKEVTEKRKKNTKK